MPPTATVIRFRPTDSTKVFTWATREYQRVGHYGLSVFADTPKNGETHIDVCARLLKVSERARIDPTTNPKYYVCAKASDLTCQGFTFLKDGDDDELDEHYCIDLGQSPTLNTVEQFLQPFHVEVRSR